MLFVNANLISQSEKQAAFQRSALCWFRGYKRTIVFDAFNNGLFPVMNTNYICWVRRRGRQLDEIILTEFFRFTWLSN